MKTNISSLDRLIRVMVGTALLTSYYFMQDTYWLLVGIVPLVTGYIGFCPLYSLCGKKDCTIK